MHESMRNAFDIFEFNSKKISNMKKKIKTKEFSETNKDDNKLKTPILMSKNKAIINN